IEIGAEAVDDPEAVGRGSKGHGTVTRGEQRRHASPAITVIDAEQAALSADGDEASERAGQLVNEEGQGHSGTPLAARPVPQLAAAVGAHRDHLAGAARAEGALVAADVRLRVVRQRRPTSLALGA